ncbi:MAG TPA: TIGR03435 family protein [Bryobacteraceae bacterium]|nr:TIGR03435 family protein [Bryobacteraceae bacterium]
MPRSRRPGLFAPAAALALAGAAATVLLHPASAQAPTDVRFEAASVKPFEPSGGGLVVLRSWSGGPGTPDPGLLQCGSCVLSDVVIKAYNLETYQLAGPGRLDYSRFQIAAKVPSGATAEQGRTMLQSLLAERFHLKAHWEQKDAAGWVLVVGKGGARLKVSAAGEPPDEEQRPHTSLNRDFFVMVPPGYPANGILTFGNGGILFSTVGGRATMAMLAQELMRKLGEPVADETGLNGKYDFTLYWAKEQPDPSWGPERLPPPEDLPLPTLSQALRTLGLDVERRKVPVKVLVVDSVDKTPTGN